jgi:hypothetical protein
VGPRHADGEDITDAQRPACASVPSIGGLGAITAKARLPPAWRRTRSNAFTTGSGGTNAGGGSDEQRRPGLAAIAFDARARDAGRLLTIDAGACAAEPKKAEQPRSDM